MKEIDLSNIDNMNLEDVEKALDIGKSESSRSNDDPPENELEFNDRLVSPSEDVRRVPTITRELMSTNISSEVAGKIIHYDNVQVKYDILKEIQKAKRINFLRRLKEKIERSKIYGFRVRVFEREYNGNGADYSRKIHMIASSAKSVEGFSVKSAKTDIKKSTEDIKSLEVTRDGMIRKKRFLPW